LVIGKLRCGAGQNLRHGLVQDSAIVGEIREHRQLRAEDHHGDEVGGCHLLRQELQRRIVRAKDVVRLHRAQVEEKDNHAAVAHLVADRLRGACSTAIDRDADRLGVPRSCRFDLLDVRI
jgi:hypothetical protein